MSADARSMEGVGKGDHVVQYWINEANKDDCSRPPYILKACNVLQGMGLNRFVLGRVSLLKPFTVSYNVPGTSTCEAFITEQYPKQTVQLKDGSEIPEIFRVRAPDCGELLCVGRVCRIRASRKPGRVRFKKHVFLPDQKGAEAGPNAIIIGVTDDTVRVIINVTNTPGQGSWIVDYPRGVISTGASSRGSNTPSSKSCDHMRTAARGQKRKSPSCESTPRTDTKENTPALTSDSSAATPPPDKRHKALECEISDGIQKMQSLLHKVESLGALPPSEGE